MGAYQVAASILCGFVAISRAAWSTERPLDDAHSPGVTFATSTVALTRILIDEELRPNTVIARVNFDDEGGALGPPQITAFEDAKNNSALGARVEKRGPNWVLVLEFPQDFERPEQRDYGLYFDTGAPGFGHKVALVTRNLNDNSPSIYPLESKCVIEENAVVSINSTACTFFAVDRDGDIGRVNFSILDNPLFSIDLLEIIDEYSAKVSLLVAYPGLDFEANREHVLDIQAYDGLFTTFLTRTVQVTDLPDNLHLPSRGNPSN